MSGSEVTLRFVSRLLMLAMLPERSRGALELSHRFIELGLINILRRVRRY